MPFTVPAAVIANLKKRGGIKLVTLLDVYLNDLAIFYFTDWNGSYPVKIGNVSPMPYLPYLSKAGPYTQSRNFQTDAGDIVLQNVKGNTIDREVGGLLVAHEFEGALAVVRFWEPLAELVVEEHHGQLTDQQDLGDTISFRMTQLLDGQAYEICTDDYQEQCSHRFKNKPCGSVSANTFCNKNLGADSHDCTQLTRFNGCPNPPPSEVKFGSQPVRIMYDDDGNKLAEWRNR